MHRLALGRRQLGGAIEGDNLRGQGRGEHTEQLDAERSRDLAQALSLGLEAVQVEPDGLGDVGPNDGLQLAPGCLLVLALASKQPGDGVVADLDLVGIPEPGRDLPGRAALARFLANRLTQGLGDRRFGRHGPLSRLVACCRARGWGGGVAHQRAGDDLLPARP